jgi:hypothetical protein
MRALMAKHVPPMVTHVNRKAAIAGLIVVSYPKTKSCHIGSTFNQMKLHSQIAAKAAPPVRIT